MADEIDHLLAECQRIEQYSRINASTHYDMAESSAKVAKVLALIPSIIGGGLAVVVAAEPSIPTDGAAKWVTFALLIVSGVFSSVLAALNPSKTKLEHQRAGGKFKVLENQARRAHEVFQHEETREMLVLRVHELTRRYDELIEEVPLTETGSYKAALGRVREGTYEPD